MAGQMLLPVFTENLFCSLYLQMRKRSNSLAHSMGEEGWNQSSALGMWVN